MSLDKDVAAALEKVCRTRKASMKSVVNEALRQGLTRMADRRPVPRERFQTRVLPVGRSLLGNLDNVAEVLAVAEGERFK